MTFFSKLLVKILFLSLSFAALASPTSKAQPWQVVDMQAEILHYINQYREAHGLSALAIDKHITQEAINHSIAMAVHRVPVGHAQFENRFQRLRHVILDTRSGAENVAYAYKDARDVVTQWINSPAHRQNIRGHYNLTGIGVVRDTRGKLYFTQLFIKTV